MLWGKSTTLLLFRVVPLFIALVLKWLLSISRVFLSQNLRHLKHWFLFFDNFLNIFFHPAWSVFKPATITIKRVFKHIIIFLWIACSITHSTISSYLITLMEIWQSFKFNIVIKIQSFIHPRLSSVLLGMVTVQRRPTSKIPMPSSNGNSPSLINCSFWALLNFTGTTGISGAKLNLKQT